MAITVKELKDWLWNVANETLIGVDETGMALALQEPYEPYDLTGSYEIGTIKESGPDPTFTSPGVSLEDNLF